MASLARNLRSPSNMPPVEKPISKRTMRQNYRLPVQLAKTKLQNKHYMTKKDFESLEGIEEVPRIYPDQEEYDNPIRLLARLTREGYPNRYGAVVIVAPSPTPPRPYGDDTPIRTRNQRLMDLKKGLPFSEDNKYTVGSFREYS